MWVLRLNDMRAPKIEMLTNVCRAETMEELEDFVQSQEVEKYVDGQWAKFYRKNGPLEWFNRPFSGDMTFSDVGTEEDWRAQATEQFRKLTRDIIDVQTLKG